MRKVVLLGLLGMWPGLVSVSLGQLSMFPAPPPLAPRQSTEKPLPISSVPTTNAAGGSGSPGVEARATSAVPATPNGTDLAPVTAATITSMTALDDKVALQPGDRISFRVLEDRDDAVPRIVTDTGEVDFPYIGRVKVAGQTCRQVAVALKKLLEVDYYKRATVIVGLDVMNDHEKENHQMAWIVGQVRQVGPQELSQFQPVTVSQVILRAGGFGDFADQRRIRLFHRQAPSSTGPATEPSPPGDSQAGEIVDVKAVFEGKSKVDPVVMPNDLIVIPKRLVNF